MKENHQTYLNFYAGLFEQICSMEQLEMAFKAVKRNRGAPGVDGVTIEEFSRTPKRSLQQLQEEVTEWRYKPQPVKRVEIPKPNGGTRNLGIPTVKDRIIQMSIKMALEPMFDPEFSENSFGFRPNRSQAQAIKQAKEIVSTGREWVVDIDLSKFFDRINHERLVAKIKTKVKDRRVIRLIGMTLRSGISIDGKTIPSEEGSVQGSPLSPLLSNIVLDELDKELEKRGHLFCRYADDMNAFVKTERAARRTMDSLCRFIEGKMKLVVNREKSKVALSKDVKFLGMTIVNKSISIAKSSIEVAMKKVKELTPRGTYLPLEKSIEKINRWYRGWSNYYKMTEYPFQLSFIEAHIRRRLRARIVSQQKKKRHLVDKLIKMGIGPNHARRTAYSNRRSWAMSRTDALHRAFPNKWFAEQGLYCRSEERLEHWKERRKWVKLT